MADKKRILISRNVLQESILARFCADKGIELIGESFIRTDVIPDIQFPKTDWIFFSSPRAVLLFFEYYSVEDQKIAVLGEGTADALSKYGRQAQFVGETNMEPSTIGKTFAAKIAQKEKVLFPISQISRRSVSSQLQNENKAEVVFYETHLDEKEIDSNFDCIIFTSPSNVDGFLAENVVLTSTTLLCLGELTKQHLEERQVSVPIFNVGTSEQNWVTKIKELIHPPDSNL